MVAILGQDCSLVFRSFRFPTLLFLPSLCETFRQLLPFLLDQSCFRRWPLPFKCSVPVPRRSLTRILQLFYLLWNFACLLLSRPSKLPCWLIVDRFFQIHIACASGCAPIRWKRSNVPTTSCRGLHHTQSRLLASPLSSTCYALSSSLRKECWHLRGSIPSKFLLGSAFSHCPRRSSGPIPLWISSAI